MRHLLFFALLCATSLLHAQTTIESDEAHYDGEFIHLTGHVHVVSDMGMVEAQQARITTLKQDHDKWEATYILLTGAVKMTNAERSQFALADKVEIFPQEKTMVFESLGDERVLFIDIAKHMQLAAHKIRAERAQQDTVQGYGDVRFVFGSEELERLKAQFVWE